MPDDPRSEPGRAGPVATDPGLDPRPHRPLAGEPLPHESAWAHATGTARYIDDTPMGRDELLVDFVGAPVAHGRIVAIDLGDVASVPGIVAVLTSSDVPGENTFGPIFHDEELLASEFVHHLGQPVVLLAGVDRESLRAAKARVKVACEPLPAVFSIDEAVALGQFLGPTRRIARGDAAQAIAAAPHLLEGVVTLGGQDHFALETQAAIAEPGEDGEVTVHSSTQNPSEVQSVVARCLGLRQNQVVCICRRMGGGFGGKETQAAHPALMAALVAAKTSRTARIVYPRDLDMTVTGKRHPYRASYRVGFADDGRILGLSLDLHSDGGFSADLSLAVMERSMLHADNAYFLPDVTITGTVCRTNHPSNTAFRGFGGPQGIAAIEDAIDAIAGHLGLDPLAVRRINCYGGEGRDVTPYGQVVRDNTLPAILDRLAETSEYHRRRARIATFNARSKTRARGLALVPVKFGISFTRRTLNQGNALVNLYLDGTAQVSTGGTEMGQGLNTKIRQLVADQFALPAEAVRVMATSTEKNNNTSPTAASASTDLNGTAAIRACEILRARLADVAARRFASVDLGLENAPEFVRFENGQVVDERRPDLWLSFAELVRIAYEARVDLGARGFYATPGVDYNRETGRGHPFLYYTNGAAVTEVDIDRLTGEMKVTRVDVLMDVGRSINPAVDVGQIVGGFVQGMGWASTEELRYGPDGSLLTCSPNSYKIPHVHDVPADFRVVFLDNPANVRNLFASKAVGEPPFVLGLSVWAAVRDAIRSATGVGRVPLRLPATGEEILRHLDGP